MKLYIKNMVSISCKMIVKAELEKLGLSYHAVELGEIEIKNAITETQHHELKVALSGFALELMDDKKVLLVEKIKNAVIDLVHYSEEPPKTTFSVYLSNKLNYDYTYLANLFSQITGDGIEHFHISRKIERAKELIIYNELTLTQISSKLNYSSVSHLSNQFKKFTGLTPSAFKKLKHKRRQPGENV
ncbi:MAG: helix-turn-helix transcriptional regulator [Bacteroidota bacterium]|nr:helix-turn-helix transcriptional regulator [Bacteroidota bacterium]